MISKASKDFSVDFELSWGDTLKQVLVIVTVEDEAAGFAGILTSIMHTKHIELRCQTLSNKIWILEMLIKSTYMHRLVVRDNSAVSIERCSGIILSMGGCAIILHLLRLKTPWVNDEILKAQNHITIPVLSRTLLHQF